eukprot:12896978-Prorocentrum_lima.AAC.1
MEGEERVWTQKLPLLWAQSCILCFHCWGPVLTCGGSNVCQVDRESLMAVPLSREQVVAGRPRHRHTECREHPNQARCYAPYSTDCIERLAKPKGKPGRKKKRCWCGKLALREKCHCPQ